MGYDLTISPLRNSKELYDTEVLALNTLRFNPDYRLFEQIKEINENKPIIIPLPIPPQMKVGIYEEEGLSYEQTDAYGDALTFVYAKELKRLKLPDDVSPRNRAIKPPFIHALPDDTPILLLWS